MAFPRILSFAHVYVNNSFSKKENFCYFCTLKNDVLTHDCFHCNMFNDPILPAFPTFLIQLGKRLTFFVSCIILSHSRKSGGIHIKCYREYLFRLLNVCILFV